MLRGCRARRRLTRLSLAAVDVSFEAAVRASNSTVVLDSQGPSAAGNGKVKEATCPGKSTPRPLGRHAHAAAYVESHEADSLRALFVFGGRENRDTLVPLGDLW